MGADAHVLDVATGTGAVAAELVRQHGCRVTGIDPSPDMLRHARTRLHDAGAAGRVELVEGRAEQLPFDDASFDALTVTYLLRYVEDPAATLRELARVLRPGATLVSLDFAVPPQPLVRTAWRCYVEVGLPAAGALVGPGWYRAGRFLAKSIPDFDRRHPMGELVGLYAAAGLEGVALRRMSLGGGAVIWGRRTAAAA